MPTTIKEVVKKFALNILHGLRIVENFLVIDNSRKSIYYYYLKVIVSSLSLATSNLNDDNLRDRVYYVLENYRLITTIKVNKDVSDIGISNIR